MSSRPNSFRVIDSHTGGEPTRVIVSGGPDLGRGTMAERRAILKESFDGYRRAICNEPRGSDVMVGAILCEPVDPKNAAGVIFFNNVGYLNMCGHGTIGLIETLRWLGAIDVGTHTIETPVGNVSATLREDRRVSFQNVPSYRAKRDVIVEVPTFGPVTGDIAWGGNWFFLVTSAPKVAPVAGLSIDLHNASVLFALSYAIMQALAAQKITGENGAPIDHVELFGPSSSGADSKNFVLCPGGAYDRSPCGTGTSAKLACLAADGMLKPGQTWVQESIVGTRFEASYQPTGDGKILPTITGRAFVNGDVTVILHPDDPFAQGIG
jgi:4-hydroxyproline epimerase